MEIWRKLGALALFSLCAGFANAEVVGLTEGQFRVDESGAATYNLPIATPAGRAGVTPQVSLSYSSNNMAEGPVGVGWSISGMSSISRCPPTPLHDGKIQAVQFSNQDKLCLDGRRLILKSGTYLYPNSTYRFEVDDFSEIIARGGSSTNGPQYFEVHNKAGEVHYYGNSAAISTMFNDHTDAFVEPGGFSANVKAKSWMLKLVKDIKSNFILYNYDKDPAKGSLYLESIEYSGNISLNKPPFAKIEFKYRPYEKGFKGYYSGAHFYHDQLLETVQTSIDNDIYRTYLLNYEESAFIEERTLLTSVQECPDDGSILDNCRNATNFEWQRPNLSSSGQTWQCETEPGMENFCHWVPTSTNYVAFPSSSTISTSAPNRYQTQVMDINGDGFQDLVYVSGSYWYAKFGPYFYDTEQLTNIGVSKKDYAMSIDYNGDGVRDLLVANSKTSNWYAISYVPSTGTFPWCPPSETCTDYTYTTDKTVKNLGVVATGLEGEAQVMDVNGDGNEDIVFRSGSTIKAHLNDGDGTFTANKTLYTFSGTTSFGETGTKFISQTADMKSSSQIDINGDGRSDLIMKVSRTTGGCYLRGTLMPFINNQYECQYDIGGTWNLSTTTLNTVYLATGTLNDPTLTELTYFSGYVDNLRVADFNGDGLSDLAYVANNKWYYRLSNGQTLLSPREMGLATNSTLKDYNQFVDLNGDGRADVLHATSTSKWFIYFSRPTTSGEWIHFEDRGSMNFDNNAVVRFGDTNGDGKLDLLTSTGSTWKRYYNRSDIKEFVISKITNGLGVETTIDYRPMTDTSVYVMQASDENINSDTFSPISGASLVKQVNTQSSITSTVGVRYEYGGLLIHKKGRGSLGFAMLRTIDLQTDVVSETQYYQKYSGNDFAKIGMPVYSEQSKNGTLLSKAINTLAVRSTAYGGLFPYISNSEEWGLVYNSNGSSSHLSTTQTTNTYDSWGNPLTINVTVTDETDGKFMETRTTNTWGTSTEQRYGRLKQTTVVKNRTGDTDNTSRVTTFSYRSDKLLGGSVVSPTSSATRLVTSYGYDSYGNRTQTSVTGYSTAIGTNQTRTSKVVYDTRGRYVKYEENALGERNNYLYNGQSPDSVTGVITNMTLTGPNNLPTRTYYDDFGQISQVDYPDSKFGYTTRSWCSNCEGFSLYKVRETVSGSPAKESFFDKWGRLVASRVQGFDGAWWTTKYTYTTDGLQYRVYEPNSTLYTETIYDDLNRPEEVRKPDGSTVSTYYNGRETRTTDELGISSYVYTNGFGETDSTRDAFYNLVYFTYDAFGNLTQSRTRAHNKDSIITNVYDSWGRKLSTTDPIKGTWEYTYNAFNELYTQKTARNHTTTFTYDVLGRKVRSHEPSEGTLCWNYGSTAHASQKAVGKLLSKAKYDGTDVACDTTATPTIKKHYYYDSLGRPRKERTQIGSTYFDQEQTYDSYSRPDVTTYPLGTVAVQAKKHYNTNGYFYKTTRVSDGYLIQEILSMNSRGQVTEYKNGNQVETTMGYDSATGWLETIDVAKNTTLLHFLDVSHDARGNVKTRRSNYASSIGIGSDFTETYAYDALNRLKSRTISIASGSGSLPTAFKASQSYDYDNWGNLKYKTGVGYYKYDTTNVHKLLGVYTNSNYTGVKYSFRNEDYDANGNITNDGTRSFTYASFDKPINISKTGSSSIMKYGIDRDLYFKEDNYYENGSPVRYRRYYIGAYEQVVRTGGNGNITEHKYQIGNAVITYRSGSTTTTFVHKDNQGSVIATTNASGQVLTQAIYDPFGKQSEVYTNSSYLTSLPPITDKGYTGHKQMNHVDIIHMNGRIYDPTLGRFLQADPIIQAPGNSQSYNRYAYVFNNPLKYTDPSGYSAWTKFRDKILKPIAAIVVAYYTGQWAQGWAWISSYGAVAQGAIVGAAAGGAAGFVATGSLKGTLQGAFSGAVFGGIGGYFNGGALEGGFAHVGSHALAGGIISDLQGGKFGHGFFSAGLTKAANINGIVGREASKAGLRIALAAVVGGTVSKLTGGKFANGATTAAFAQAFNGEDAAKKFREQRAHLKPTDSEYEMVREGKLADMWKSRCERGDPIGCVGYGTWGDPSDVSENIGNYWVGVGATVRANAYAGLYFANGAAPSDTLLLQFGQDIAIAHLDATASDLSSINYYLSAPEITSYHHTVFDSYGVNRGFYGGSWATGSHDRTLEIFYCQPACDYGKY